MSLDYKTVQAITNPIEELLKAAVALNYWRQVAGSQGWAITIAVDEEMGSVDVSVTGLGQWWPEPPEEQASS